ncbi:MAG: ypdB 2 [Acidobacteria bacterium]|jgi:two-component system LytT family response regulator/two-component system response regulator LytT|nr:ypdB 2 [Acidobacteriota bacterium]
MKPRALVVDDEQLAREELCFLLGQHEVDVVGQAVNGVEAIGALEDLEPDVVFLDIQMPGMTGFEVARHVARRGLPVEVVFVTAYDRHAIEAFEVNAVDYLLKPVDSGRLQQALQRLRRRLGAGEEGLPRGLKGEDLERLVQLVSERRQRPEQLAVKVGERLLLVHTDEIVYASLEDDTIRVVANGLAGTSSCRTLDELQAQLNPAVFWRVHRSHLVNINKIKEIVPWFSRNYILRMKDAKSTEIPVSRAQTRRLRDYLRL